jgi:hypothetical protein
MDEEELPILVRARINACQLAFGLERFRAFLPLRDSTGLVFSNVTGFPQFANEPFG